MFHLFNRASLRGSPSDLPAQGPYSAAAALPINSRFNPFAVTVLRVTLAATLGLAGGVGAGGNNGLAPGDSDHGSRLEAK